MDHSDRQLLTQSFGCAFRCGYVAIIGRPNVGKSSLMNRLINYKLSIISAKPQTTRHRINGIMTDDEAQVIFIDTPGVHDFSDQYRGKSLNRQMNQAAASSLLDADLVLFVVQANQWGKQEDDIVALVSKLPKTTSVFLLINKVDLIVPKERLLNIIERLQQKCHWAEILPISVAKGDNLESLVSLIKSYLPKQPAIFSEDAVTDSSERFLVSEIIREKLTIHLNQELPYGIAVHVEEFSQQPEITKIRALIVVEKPNHKLIVIGKKGQKLKQIGELSRHAIIKLLDHPVYLSLWVKVRENWSDDLQFINSLNMKDG